MGIVRQRLLRTGDLEFTATTATDVDQWIVIVNERLTKTQMAELFVGSGNPTPRQTLKSLGAGVLICDRITCNQRPNQGHIWNVNVHWKELEDDQPNQQSRPTPNSGSIDPNDWAPTWQRRTVIVQEPANKAVYLRGYDFTAENWITAAQDADDKSPLVNSALQRIDYPCPERRRRIFIWTFRWLRPNAPTILISAEGKLNSSAFSFTLGGASFTWDDETALIDAVNLSKMKWGNSTLVEISVEIAHDPEGWEWEVIDKGTARRRLPGDPGQTKTLLDPGESIHEAIKGADGKAIQDPVFLDGKGQPKTTGGSHVSSFWMDYKNVNFSTVTLIKDLGS